MVRQYLVRISSINDNNPWELIDVFAFCLFSHGHSKQVIAVSVLLVVVCLPSFFGK